MDIDDEALSAARALLELHGGNQYDKTRPTQTILTSNYGKMCPLCTKTFIFSISLKTHMSVTHKKFLCDLCDAVFSRPWQLSKHRETHPSTNFYSCPICLDPFPTSIMLRRHLQTHSVYKYESPDTHSQFNQFESENKSSLFSRSSSKSKEKRLIISTVKQSSGDRKAEMMRYKDKPAQTQADSSCPICADKISGPHYGTLTCSPCSSFFKRAILARRIFMCRNGGNCTIDKMRRSRCRYCRLVKCFACGMRSRNVGAKKRESMRINLLRQGIIRFK